MRAALALLVSLLVVPCVAEATPILINPGAGLAGNLPALSAFARAATAWGSLFSDPITVHIDADLGSFNSDRIIGVTQSVLLIDTYDRIRDLMVADAANEPDDAIVASLPAFAELNVVAPDRFTLVPFIVASKANLKALGVAQLDEIFGQPDARISFNSDFSFDYDRSDGIGAGLIDFETVATHEIGHALGFSSFVDAIDIQSLLGIDGLAAFEPLDLFRFGSAPGSTPTTAATFTTAPRLLMPGVEAVFSDVASAWALSTGQYTGDGRQASHWKDDGLSGVLIGVMDPTLPGGVVQPLRRFRRGTRD